MSEDLYVATFLLIFLTFYLREKILYLKYIEVILLTIKLKWEIKNIGYPNAYSTMAKSFEIRKLIYYTMIIYRKDNIDNIEKILRFYSIEYKQL